MTIITPATKKKSRFSGLWTGWKPPRDAIVLSWAHSDVKRYRKLEFAIVLGATVFFDRGLKWTLLTLTGQFLDHFSCQIRRDWVSHVRFTCMCKGSLVIMSFLQNQDSNRLVVSGLKPYSSFFLTSQCNLDILIHF